MTKLTNFLESELVDHMIGNAYTAPTTIYLALFTAVPGEAGGGTEVTGSGYARQAITWNAESGGAATNNGAVEFTPSGGNYGTVVATALMDALTVGNMLAYDVDFVDQAVNDGETLSFATSTGISFSLD